MGILAWRHYDPATSVTKSTAAALGMTALDTTNLRNTFVGPSNGAVMVRMRGVIHGGTATPWTPLVFFGVLAGGTVVARSAAAGGVSTVSAAGVVHEATFLVAVSPGVTTTWDAAYGVEIPATGSVLRYGGPNDTTAANAGGGFGFEVWDT